MYMNTPLVMVQTLFTITTEKMKQLFLLLILCVPFKVIGQQYIDKEGMCQLSLLNDSMYCIFTYSLAELKYYDTGYYKTIGDTLFLTSARTPCLMISQEIDTSNMSREYGRPFLIKGYCHQTLLYEYVARNVYVDNDVISLYCPYSFDATDIIVVYDNWLYRRTYLRASTVRKKHGIVGFYITIVPDKMERVYFDRFPLLKKGNKLIPLDNNKNNECMIYNGFYVPKMTISEKIKPRQKRCVLYRGSFDFNPIK